MTLLLNCTSAERKQQKESELLSQPQIVTSDITGNLVSFLQKPKKTKTQLNSCSGNSHNLLLMSLLNRAKKDIFSFSN